MRLFFSLRYLPKIAMGIISPVQPKTCVCCDHMINLQTVRLRISCKGNHCKEDDEETYLVLIKRYCSTRYETNTNTFLVREVKPDLEVVYDLFI